MKNLKYLLFLLPLLAGCRKTPEGFDMSYRRTFTIPVGLSTFETHTFVFNDIAVDSAVFFKVNGIDSANLVGQIAPRSMNVRLVFNGDGNLSFIRRVEVSIFDTQMSPSSEKVVFYNDDVPFSVTGQLTLVPFNSDVRKLFLSGNGRYNLRVRLNFREVPPRSFDVEWNAIFLAKT
jgi:hypothetical protein